MMNSMTMQTAAPRMTSTRTTSTRTIWAGRIFSGLAVTALAADALGKLIVPQMMIANSPPLGLAPDSALYRVIGAILAICLVLHVWKRTSVLGAVLLTGFLGGAVAINVRAGMPLFSNTLTGVYVGALIWVGLWLRDARVRSLLG